MLVCLDNLASAAPIDRPLHAARHALLSALDLEQLWRACVDFVSATLPYHSCSLLFDIEGFQPQRGRHHLANAIAGTALPVTSLDVAAPYLHEHPRVRCYTFSQIALTDIDAQARLQAQKPAPGWREFIHLAFWDDNALDAVLSLRLPTSCAALRPAEQTRLTELYVLLESGLQRIRVLEPLRTRQRACEALLEQMPTAAMVIDTHARPLHLTRQARGLCLLGGAQGTQPPRLLPVFEQALARWISRSRWRALPTDAAQPADELRVSDPMLGTLRLQITPRPATERPAAFLVTVLDTPDSPPATIGSTPHPQDAALQRLSPSERRVAMLVAQGLRNAEIAQRLCRSHKTIETQVSAVFRKLDLVNRSQLVRMMV